MKDIKINSGLLIILIVVIVASAFGGAAVNEIAEKPIKNEIPIVVELRWVVQYETNSTYVFSTEDSSFVLSYYGDDLTGMEAGKYTFWIKDCSELVRYELWPYYDL